MSNSVLEAIREEKRALRNRLVNIHNQQESFVLPTDQIITLDQEIDMLFNSIDNFLEEFMVRLKKLNEAEELVK